ETGCAAPGGGWGSWPWPRSHAAERIGGQGRFIGSDHATDRVCRARL
ncbi:MAG: hypothetical protein AVDCRST_MAG76-379, partial [uncultured Acidimicrobiales bacterium]